MDILVIALSIYPRPLSALELKLSGLIMESWFDTAGDEQNAHMIIRYHMGILVIARSMPLSSPRALISSRPGNDRSFEGLLETMAEMPMLDSDAMGPNDDTCMDKQKEK